MNQADFYLYLIAIAAFAWLAGFAFGRHIGRNEERVRQTIRRTRQRRPLIVNVDYTFAARAFHNAGYEVRQIKKELH